MSIVFWARFAILCVLLVILLTMLVNHGLFLWKCHYGAWLYERRRRAQGEQRRETQEETLS